MRKVLLAIALGIVAGCDEAPRARRPPVNDSGEETADDVRDRRRGARAEMPAGSEETRDVPADDRRRRAPDDRKERAIEAAEDAADAATDRPLRPN